MEEKIYSRAEISRKESLDPLHYVTGRKKDSPLMAGQENKDSLEKDHFAS